MDKRDDEVQEFVINSYERTKDVLREHRDQLDSVANVLLVRETLTSDEFTAVMEGRPLPVKVDTSDEDTDTPAEVEPVLTTSPATA